jgi:uncharacterized membrane protein YesL
MSTLSNTVYLKSVLILSLLLLLYLPDYLPFFGYSHTSPILGYVIHHAHDTFMYVVLEF